MNNKEVKKWITVNGNHIPIFEDGSKGGILNNKYENDIDIDIKEINPDRDSMTFEESRNCQKCALALEMRYRGKKFVANKNKPLPKYTLVNYIANQHYKLNHNWEESDFSYQGKISASVAKESLSEFPNTRWYISIPWKGNLGSHAFNAIVDEDGKVKFLDSQNPELDAESYFKDMTNSMKKQIRFLRMDNIDFDENFIKEGEYFK